MEIGAIFKSYSDFLTVLEQYEEQSLSNYRKQDSTTIDRARKKQPKHVFRDDLKYSYLKLVCQYGGICKSRGRGTRPNRRSLKTDCPALIIVGASSDGNTLVVRSVVSNHNHEVSNATFKRSVRQRTLIKDEEANVHTLLQLGGHFYEDEDDEQNFSDGEFQHPSSLPDFATEETQ